MTPFNTDALDLDAYLARIAFDRGSRPAGPPDLATLQQLALLHPCAIAFENLNPLLRRPVHLDIGSIQQKLVRDGRGGWCFEHNLLLGTALKALGYDVAGLSARVVWNVPAGVVRGRSHMVLHVTLDGQSFIVDAGFGGPTPTAPLLVDAGIEQTSPHEPVRLTAVGAGFVLETRLEGMWKALYTFDLQPQVLADYEMPNWYLCTHPDSHFLGRLMAARVQRDRRLALRNADLAVHFPNGVTERRTLANGAEVRQALEDLFNIRVPAGADVDAALARVVA